MNPFQQQEAFYSDPAGVLKNQGETFFYGYIKFEASPLNRIEETFAAGNSWIGTAQNATEDDRRSVKSKYWINTAADAVRIWNVSNHTTPGNLGGYSSPGAYPAGQLYKNVTVDEHGKQVIEFKDKEGQIVLKKVQLTAAADDGNGSGHSGWLCTYYIYDDLNQLRCVIQPRGVELIASNWLLTDATILAEQCFRYEYDHRQRMIVKKVPGAGEVYMIYDKRDRLVMTQDAQMKPENRWLVTKYDALNRPTKTGIWTITGDADYHRNAAMTLPEGQFIYPQTVSNYENLTETWYDSYEWIAQTGGAFSNADYDNAWDGEMFSASTTVYPYPVANAKSNLTKGMVTGTKTKILGTSTYLYSMIIYDDKGRVIQTKSTNATGGTDIATTQYGWQGLPLITVERFHKISLPGGDPQTLTIATKNTYDELGRVIKTEKKQAHNQLNGGIMSDYATISEIKYDALGQVKEKKLAPEYNGTGLQTLSYDYNIRGWLLGVNRDYITDPGTPPDKHFGFDLGYDKKGMLDYDYLNKQYNGNISGTIWKSAGDGEKRKYDFSYDAANRLMLAHFGQYNTNNKFSNDKVNFNAKMGDGSNPNTAYDANGNIKLMYHYGLKVNSSQIIDKLVYSYETRSNRLSKVIDEYNDENSTLGDFKYNAATKGSVDYTYDANGNLISDANKKITSITYNHLNLPEVITVDGKGTITYTYDATGNKLKKTTVDNTISPAKTTTILYLGSAVYENDELQFMAHEEGRIRPLKDAENNLASFAYDYFLKDHLGNVRMVLTDEQKSDSYPPASMETVQAATEEALYANISETRVDKPVGYPTDTYTDPNDKVAKTNGNGNKIGPSIILKVMAGDAFNLRASSWYKANGTAPGNPNSIATDLLTTFFSSLSGISGFEHGSGALSQLQNSGAVPLVINSFLGTQPAPGSTKPKAYLNWVLLDEQFNFVQSSSGAEQVGNDQELKVYTKNNLPVAKNGYLYVFVSNETPNVDVFFDNLQITHIRGPILEETHYYPFGLTMAGISSKAAGGVQNRYKFNDGTELENREFSDGSGLELYATEYRSYDPQIGRFHQIDELTEFDFNWSPYVYAHNNPILLNDPLGLTADTTGTPGFAPDNPTVLPEIVVTTRKRSSVGQPGFAESIIPVWGSGRAAIDDFQNGRWGWGIFNSVVAVSDVFLVKSAITAVGKLVAKGVGELAAKEGVYIITTESSRYVGQSKSMAKRLIQHLKKGGKLSKETVKKVLGHEMPGSDKLEREIYEQYLIIKYGGPKGGNLLNQVNPMGGRMEKYAEKIEEVITKYKLPR